ncbi:hypothetical protein OGAPHI_003798 [Ogataea philodendri]|uniref:TAFII55 protein conserved region domain-containing protein n=1 Tax=Ogataea philodendri TaxID=1378263 RepID=A0A9P8P5H9_9ASCO|nr:uncharacterized protein OGAPHI_003798 [Ogataea philodendri]KAH3665610.1 hypothetical protein OGAPHI_003798 [Ogataea philodendri]
MPKLKIKLSNSSDDKPKIRLKSPAKPSDGLPTLKLTTSARVPTIRVKPTRTPGDGYDSEDPDREDDPLIEEGIVLRMIPDESLDHLRRCVEDGDLSGINIKWKDKKRAILRINGLIYGGKLVDLPSVVEVQKSVDKKNIFKTIDVCQMLLIVKRLESEKDYKDIPIDMEQGETYPDGLTPPLEKSKNRFKKRYQQKVMQTVEDRVQQLLDLDDEAESSTYTFIDPSEEASSYGTPEPRIKKKKKKVKDTDSHVDDELNRLMLEEEDDDLDDLDDLDQELEAAFEERRPDEEEEEEIIEGASAEEEHESSDDDDDDDEEEEEDEQPRRAGGEMNEAQQHNAILREEISELEATIDQKSQDLAKANNPIIRNRINDVIGRLKQELELKRLQIREEEAQPTLQQEEDEEDEEDEADGDGDDENEDDLADLF